jgi:hypothetical protein
MVKLISTVQYILRFKIYHNYLPCTATFSNNNVEHKMFSVTKKLCNIKSMHHVKTLMNMLHLNHTHSIAVTHPTRNFITARAEQEIHESDPQF